MIIDRETLQRISDILDEDGNTRPLYVFMDEHDLVLDCEWFDSRLEAIAHARTLYSPVVNVLLYVGYAENENESFGTVGLAEGH